LHPNNNLAWELYWDTRGPCKEILLQLEDFHLSEQEAEETALKIRALSIKINELEFERAKQQQKKGAR